LLFHQRVRNPSTDFLIDRKNWDNIKILTSVQMLNSEFGIKLPLTPSLEGRG